jgi:Protein of unknown function (DUF1573)
MKKILLAIAIIGMSTAASAQATATATAKKADEALKFSEVKYDFGKIPQGKPVTHDFPFKNIGEAALIIENATASCGCTTPTWPQKPIAKGGSDKVTAGFNAANAGTFEKTVFVKVKGYDLPVELKISGEVVAAEAKKTN